MSSPTTPIDPAIRPAKFSDRWLVMQLDETTWVMVGLGCSATIIVRKWRGEYIPWVQYKDGRKKRFWNLPSAVEEAEF